MHKQTDISQQIKKYLNGELDARAMNELERRAQDDPFLMDALDGYQANTVDTDGVLNELSSRLQQRITKKEARIIPWRIMGIAASILILLGLGLFWYEGRKPTDTAQKYIVSNPLIHPPVAAKSATAVNSDSIPGGKHELMANNTRHQHKPKMIYTPPVTDVAQPAAVDTTATAKETTPLNEMIVMDYTAGQKAAAVSKANADKVTDSSFVLAEKKTMPVAKYDTAKLKEVMIKGTDIAKLDNSPNAYSVAHTPNLEMTNQNLSAYQARVAQANNITIQSARAYTSMPAGNAMHGYLAKRSATAGSIAPLNPVIVHGKMVHGIVKAAGEPLPYAAVKIKGTTISTLTDDKGWFTLYAVPDSAILQVSAEGYATRETRVTKRDLQVISVRSAENILNDAAAAPDSYNIVPDNSRARPSTGWDDLNAYLRQNAISPDGKTGIVKLSFTVNADNSLSDFKVVKSVSPQTDNLAVKLVKDGPAWYSAADDKPEVITISIKFRARSK